MLIAMSAMALQFATELKSEKPVLRAMRRQELARTISGKRVETDASTPERLRLQVTEDFYKDGRYLRFFHGREALGRYRFQEDAVCVNWRAGSWECRIAVVDAQGQMWFVRTLDPAEVWPVSISDIPK